MKKIKFRGKSKYSGKIIYGDLNCGQKVVCVDDEPVYPETVAQFIGYDKNGKEIYSDDNLRVYFEGAYGVETFSQIEKADDFFTFSDIGETFDYIEVMGG